MSHNPAYDEGGVWNTAGSAVNLDPADDAVRAAVAAAPPGNRHILTFYADGVVGMAAPEPEPSEFPADDKKEN